MRLQSTTLTVVGGGATDGEAADVGVPGREHEARPGPAGD